MNKVLVVLILLVLGACSTGKWVWDKDFDPGEQSNKPDPAYQRK